MQRWIASAAGGASQRLNPGLAIVLDLSSQLFDESAVRFAMMSSPTLFFRLFLSPRPQVLIPPLRLGSGLVLQRGDGPRRRGIQPRLARIQIADDLTNHFRCPEAFEMGRDASSRRLLLHRSEEIADLVRHPHQLFDLRRAHAAAPCLAATAAPGKPSPW